jgi:hypothetical protein
MFCALESPRAVIANVRVSVHVDVRCCSIFGVVEVGGLWRGRALSVLGTNLPPRPSSAESQSSQGCR